MDSGAVTLSDEEARHAVASRRLSVGDAVVLFDGAGGEADGTIIRCDRRSVEVEPGTIRLRSRAAEIRRYRAGNRK